MTFEKGESYWATATADRTKKKIFTVTARQGRRVTFSRVHQVLRDIPDVIDGVEVARLRDADGFDYVLSSRVPVDIDEALEIAEVCR